MSPISGFQPTGRCPSVGAHLVRQYADGVLAGPAAWSVEAHLPGCAACRTVLYAVVDPDRLARNRAVLLTRLALPAPGLAERLLGRLGVPTHLVRLLTVTPSLRRSWLAGVVGTLALAVGFAWLAESGRPGAAVEWSGLLPFLVLAPLLPLAGVAAAFHRRLDPQADLAVAAPMSAIRLFYVRAVAVTSTALAPTVLAAAALPGAGWLPLLVVLPALAVTATALALSTLMAPAPAAIVAGGGWLGVVAALGLAHASPVLAFSGAGQVASAVLTAGAVAAAVARRRALHFGGFQ